MLILAVFMFSGINLAYESLSENTNVAQEKSLKEIHESKEEVIDRDEEIENLLKSNVNIKENWQIEIPVIDLVAPIAEDTTQEVMKEYVGHFTSTSMWKGNVGLAAHNRRFSN